MQRITSYAQQELKWEQPSAFKEQYDLKAGDFPIAALRWRSMWGSLATAESADGCWTFKRVGFFKTRVTVRPSNGEEDIAVYYPNTWSQGGSIELPDGRKYKVSTNFWMSKVAITDDATDETLIHYNVGGFFRHSALVEISPAALRLEELPWMVMLGWYLIILMYQDSAVIAAAAT